jgi:hypothetical protein
VSPHRCRYEALSFVSFTRPPAILRGIRCRALAGVFCQDARKKQPWQNIFRNARHWKTKLYDCRLECFASVPHIREQQGGAGSRASRSGVDLRLCVAKHFLPKIFLPCCGSICDRLTDTGGSGVTNIGTPCRSPTLASGPRWIASAQRRPQSSSRCFPPQSVARAPAVPGKPFFAQDLFASLPDHHAHAGPPSPLCTSDPATDHRAKWHASRSASNPLFPLFFG